MKKSKILILLSALLCVVMMFASCDEPETPEPTYKDYVNEWLEYIEYTDTAATKAAAHLSADSTVTGTYGSSKNLAYTVKATVGTPAVGEDGKITAATTLTYKVYNLYVSDSTPVWEKTFTNYAATLNTQQTTANYSNVTNKPISISLRGDSGIFGITETAADGTKTYTVYNDEGAVIAENVSESNYTAYYMALPALTKYENNSNRYYIDAGVLQVYDSAYSIILEEEFVADNGSMKVLNNGDVFVMLMNMADETSEDYDVEMYGTKISVDYKLVSIATGEVKDVELDYFPSNILTANDGIKGENNLVLANKITEGKAISSEFKFYVVDNEFKLVKELKPLVKNQTSIPYFADANNLLVNAVAGTNHYIYAIDTAAEAPAPKLYATDAKLIDGGVFSGDVIDIDDSVYSGGVIYDTEMNELVDLNEDEDITEIKIVGDVVLATRHVVIYKTVEGVEVIDEQYDVYDIYAIRNGNIEKTYLGKTDKVTSFENGELWRVEGEESGDAVRIYNKYGTNLMSAKGLPINPVDVDGEYFIIKYSTTSTVDEKTVTTSHIYIYN